MNDFETKSVGGGCTITRYIGTSEVLVIPDTINGEPVRGIGNFALLKRKNDIISVTIPDSITVISTEAFHCCAALTNISVDPNNLFFSAEDGVLFNKDKSLLLHYPAGKKLNTYAIPYSVSVIALGAFSDCNNLTSISLSAHVAEIGSAIFSGCDRLENILVDSKNTMYADIDGVLFNKDKSVILRYPEGRKQSKYIIPDSVTKIGENAFNGCDRLENILVDSKNTMYADIDGVLFSKDRSVLVRYPEGKKQSAYIISDSVIKIEACAFYDCENLTEVIIPNSVRKIWGWAFSACKNLTEIIIPNRVAEIEGWAFSCCKNLTEVTIPNSVTEIQEFAFFGCENLTEVIIPNSVTAIDIWAFDGCDNLATIDICADKDYISIHPEAFPEHTTINFINDEV